MCASCSVMSSSRIDHQHHHVGALDRLQRLHHRELLHRLEHLALAADAGGVDERVVARLPSSSSTSIASRVVPGLSNAIIALLAQQRFTSVDLPTLGRPMIATRGWSGIFLILGLGLGNFASASSMSCARPRRARRKSRWGSPSASSWNSAVTTSWRMPSVLLTARNTGAWRLAQLLRDALVLRARGPRARRSRRG